VWIRRGLAESRRARSLLDSKARARNPPRFRNRLRKSTPGLEVSYRDLTLYPWIVARRASGLLDRWQQLFDKAGMERPTAPIQCGSVALIRGVLVRSDFLTLLSPDQVRAEIDAGQLIEIKSDAPDTARTIGAITRRDFYPTKLQRLFLEELRAVAKARSIPENE